MGSRSNHSIQDMGTMDVSNMDKEGEIFQRKGMGNNSLA
jgi:hypothetical protein